MQRAAISPSSGRWGLLCSNTRLRRAQRRPPLLVLAQARRGSSLEEPPAPMRFRTPSAPTATPDGAVKPRAAAAQVPRAGALVPPAAPVQHAAAAAQQQQQPAAVATTEVCGHSGSGLHVCVEHALDARGADVGALPAQPEPAAGLLGSLLDRLPLSRRTRGIVMLNLLVLLVATNWVSGRVGGVRDPRADCPPIPSARAPLAPRRRRYPPTPTAAPPNNLPRPFLWPPPHQALPGSPPAGCCSLWC